ncbi:hypothetical protein Bca101_044316 [Brassica carinata]
MVRSCPYSAEVVIDSNTGRSKGYGFVRFGDESKRSRALTEMNGALCSNRQMRVGVASPKRAVANQQQHSSQAVIVAGGHGPNGFTAQGSQSDGDSNNSTMKDLRQPFTQFGEVVSVKIPVGKGCGFVQFDNRKSADDAIQSLNGTVIGRTLSGSLGEEHRKSSVESGVDERVSVFEYAEESRQMPNFVIGKCTRVQPIKNGKKGDHAVGDIPGVRYKVVKHEEGDESEVSYKTERLAIEYYDPKLGEFVAGDEDLLFLIVKDDDEDGVEVVKFARQGTPIVEIRTMTFAEVTLGGRYQVRLIKQLNEPNDVKITECNIGRLLTILVGLGGFVPKHELMKRVNSSIEL